MEITTKNLLDLSNEENKQWLKRIETVVTDCDGVLWHDDTAIPGSVAVINQLIAVGKSVYFVTNNATKTRSQICQRAQNLGYHISEDRIIAPIQQIVNYLQKQGFDKKVYIVGSTAIATEFDAAGIKHEGVGADITFESEQKFISNLERSRKQQEFGAVVVGFDEFFSYNKILKACFYLNAAPDCIFLATNSDNVHRYPIYSIPGTGSILSAIECCAGRSATLLGKPNPIILEEYINSNAIKSNEEATLMIGDCCQVDVVFGKNCGFSTLIVGSGNYPMEKVLELYAKNPKENQKYMPNYYLPKLGDLLQYL